MAGVNIGSDMDVRVWHLGSDSGQPADPGDGYGGPAISRVSVLPVS